MRHAGAGSEQIAKVTVARAVARQQRCVAAGALAARFSAEMEGTARAVAAYGQKRATPTAIKTNGAAAETRKLVQVLSDRIEREPQQLYAAADRAA